MPEITEEEFLANRQLRQQVQQLLDHSAAGPMVEKALKLVNPNAATPRLDRLTAAQEPLEAMRKELEDFKAETAKDKAEREKTEKLQALSNKIEEGKSILRREHRYTEDGIKAVEKIMEERGLLDPLDAAAIFEKQHPPQQIATPGGGGAWNFVEQVQDGEADLKRLIETKGSNEIVSDKMAREALAEVRGQSRR